MTTRLVDAVNWARKFSVFQYPFVTACCAMEFMAVAAPKYDIARFGAEFPRFSPRQADLLRLVGRLLPELRHHAGNRSGDPGRRLHPGLSAQAGAGARRLDDVAALDRRRSRPQPEAPPRREKMNALLRELRERLGSGVLATH